MNYDERVKQRHKLRAMHDWLQRSGTGRNKLILIDTSNTIVEALRRLEAHPGTLRKAMRWLKEFCRDELGTRVVPNGPIVADYYRNA